MQHSQQQSSSSCSSSSSGSISSSKQASSHTIVQMMSISPRLVQSFPGSLNVVALAVVVAVVWCGECALQWSCSAVPLGSSAAAISSCDLHVVSSSMYNQGHFDILRLNEGYFFCMEAPHNQAQFCKLQKQSLSCCALAA
jgi:hypothetical protein